jgi:hypothetical protein
LKHLQFSANKRQIIIANTQLNSQISYMILSYKLQNMIYAYKIKSILPSAVLVYVKFKNTSNNIP